MQPKRNKKDMISRLSHTLPSITLALLIVLCGQALAQSRGTGVFQRFDLDDDGRLSREEVSGTPLESRLSAADRDEDGFISTAEFAEAIRRTRPTRGQQPPVIPARRGRW